MKVCSCWVFNLCRESMNPSFSNMFLFPIYGLGSFSFIRLFCSIIWKLELEMRESPSIKSWLALDNLFWLAVLTRPWDNYVSILKLLSICYYDPRTLKSRAPWLIRLLHGFNTRALAVFNEFTWCGLCCFWV